MTLDNTESGDNIATDSTGGSATSETASPVDTTATSTAAAPAPVEAADSSGPASAATQANADTGSLTPANTTLQAAKPQPTQTVNWEQRYSELRKREAEITRQNQQYQQQFQQYQGIDPNAVRAWQQAQQRSQQEQLPVWNRQNPNNPRFQQTQAKWAAYKDAMNRAQTPEQKQVVRETLGATFAPEEVQAVQQWENHQRDFQANFAADPAGTIAGIVSQHVQQAIQQHTQRAQAEQSVGSWFSDAANKTLVQQYGQDMMAALQRGNSWDLVRDHFAAKAKLDGLQSRVGEADKAVTAAKEKERLLQGAAAVTRDPKTATQVDPMAVAKKRGIQPGTPDYWDLLTELKESGLLPG